MESVVIVTPTDYHAHFRARIPKPYKTTESSTDTIVIEDGHNRIYLTKQQSMRDELDATQLATIDTTMTNPIFYTVDFTDIDFCRAVLLAVADDPHVLVNNDHGLLLSGADFALLLRERHSWDWRHGAALEKREQGTNAEASNPGKHPRQ